MSWVFNSTTDRVVLTDHAALTLPDATPTPWSLAGWVKLASNVGSAAQQLCSWNTYNTDPSFNLLIYEATHATVPNQLECVMRGASGAISLTPSSTAPGTSTVWQHIAVVRKADGSDHLYRDGTSIFNQSATDTGVINAAVDWFFGNRSDLARDLNGKLGEWAKWDRELTGTELTNLAVLNTGTKPETLSTNLVWHVPMYDDFLEDIAGLTVTNTGATIDSSDHPLTRGVAVVKGLRGRLVGTGATNRSGLKYAVFDQATPSAFLAPIKKGSNLTTDAEGDFEININAETSLALGAIAYVYISDTSGVVLAHKNHGGPIEVIDIA
jgi:hypothetical protein